MFRHKSHCIFFINIRLKSTQLRPEIPIISIPKYLEKNLGQSIYKEHQKVSDSREKRRKQNQNPLDQKHLNKKIISWSGDKKFYHYYGRRYDSENVPLIGKLLLKETYNGERMTIHNFDLNPSLLLDSNDNNGSEKSFESLGLNPILVHSIYEFINHGKPIPPSTIQYAVIPSILKFKNVIFSAETGSGKTLAYLAPLIQMIQQTKMHRMLTNSRRRKTPLGVVVSPSRELTEQIGNVAKHLCSNNDVQVATMIGGLPKLKSDNNGLDLVITTIGMMTTHLNNGVYSLKNLNHIVIDEADTLLDDSFTFETVDILGKLNINHFKNENGEFDEKSDDEPHVLNGTQLICASATMPRTLDSTIGSLVDLNDVEQISTKNLHTLHPNVKHTFYRVNRYKREEKLIELLFESRFKRHPVIIFANRSVAVNWLFHFLNENGFQCVRLSKDMEEEERSQSFNLFQNGEYDILVTTDLGSRGLDTSRVRHVINWNCPHYVADYIHRSGRTGRLGTSFVGQCSTLISYKPDAYMLMELERAIRLGKPIETVNANIKSQISQKRADKQEKIKRNFV